MTVNINSLAVNPIHFQFFSDGLKQSYYITAWYFSDSQTYVGSIRAQNN